MQRIQLIKWFLLILILFCIPLLCLSMPTGPVQKQNPDDPYSNIISDLRNNWQSPITYLKKRGYIPAADEHFEEKRSNSPQSLAVEDANSKFAKSAYAYDKILRVQNDDLVDSLYSRASNEKDAPLKQKPKDKKDGFLQNMKDKFLGFFGGKKNDLSPDKTQFTFNFKSDADQEIKESGGNSASRVGAGSDGGTSSNEKKVIKNLPTLVKPLANNRRPFYDTSNQKLVLMGRYM